jgi:iron-sulfur cluster repair protein YtfE (RIC family)
METELLSPEPTSVFRGLGKVPPDAILMLEQDHREVESRFAAYNLLTDEAAKQKVRETICMLLKAHMFVEEQILYPRAAAAVGDGMVNHAIAEHSKAKQLINEIELGSASDVDSLVEGLRAAIEEHVAEEETEFFPKLREASLLWYELGAAMAARRAEVLQHLKAQQG